ncbi:MAG: 1-acyl-sn-glycerol-3-phosphate acyltransferase [Planctomycetales bacterium]|nr:1-acyl-sn-glycerol-3-phosphate acyltransferase [Planctomycetales bacterium]MCA9209853.1 1-acyl-sn-glycerol-3-phosphate acyltransferase [Planctomycetales bacterium]MCA9224407.1 1-acyl-sn-glycerol-3-phosphate acyltransferase [Planctomycetales bacterium]
MSREVAAAVFLSAIPAAIVLRGLIWTWRSSFTFTQAILMGLAILLTRLLWRATIPRRLPLDGRQGAIVIANHRSSIDPFFLQVIVDRPMHWMVAKEYCEHWAFAWFLRNCEVIPVSRGGVDTAATKQAIRYALDGELLGMLPEGRINVTDQFLLPARPGAAMVAIRAGVPIVPCYIDGAPYNGSAASPIFMRARVRVQFGRPIYPPELLDGESDEQRAARFMLQSLREIAKLAGHDDFEPTLAGRRWKPSDEDVERDFEASRRRKGRRERERR